MVSTFNPAKIMHFGGAGKHSARQSEFFNEKNVIYTFAFSLFYLTFAGDKNTKSFLCLKVSTLRMIT